MSIALPILFLLIVFGICFYLADRFTLYFSLKSRKRSLIGFFVFYFLASFGSLGLVHSQNIFGQAFHWITSLALGGFLYLIFGTLLAELLRKTIKLKNYFAGFAAILVSLLISSYGVYNAYDLVITEKTIKVRDLTSKIKAVHLTDTHIGQFRSGKELEKIIEIINSINPEVVFFTGDLLDSQVELNENVIAFVGNINAPVFFVDGNHDINTGVSEIVGYLRKHGVHDLRNEVKEWNGMQIIGLNFMLADEDAFDMHAQPGKDTVKSALSKINLDPNKATILLHHGPYGAKYANDAGVDLYLAGHTHGGQLFPFNILGDYIFEYNAGLFEYKGMKISVPFGTGTFGPPMRVGTKSELSIINLIPVF